MRRFVNIFIGTALAALALLSASCADAKVRQYKVQVVKEYIHDETSFTQGLFFLDGEMIETTGQYGESTLRKVDLATGKALKRFDFDKKYFLEGSVELNGNIFILTWLNKVAFVYDAKTLAYKSTWSYPREGWGLTTKDNNVKIKWIDVPFSEGEKRTLSAMLSSNPPDLINLNPDFSALLAQKGALAEIDRSQLKDFNDEIVDSLSYNGKIYAIPWYATSAITFYNKNLLQSNSLPKTYKDLMKIKKMNAYVFMPAISENDTMLKILNKYGISSYADINSEKSVKVFKMFKDMYNSGLIP